MRSIILLPRIIMLFGLILISGTMILNAQQDQVNGNLIQFSDNGGWCWYQDERAVVDMTGGKLIVGSVENGAGVGGSPRQGDIAAILHDLETGMSERFLLKDALTSFGGGDDHNAPAFLIRPDGKVVTCYAGHNNDFTTYYRIYNGETWGEEQTFNWNSNIPGGSNFRTTYSNLFYLSSEGLTYNIARSDERSPNMMVSEDLGETWSYGGLLTQPDVTIGYVNGYFKYWSNGIDRVDFICTKHHPRDFNTSIYHGYIQNGQTFLSNGTQMDTDISDQTAPNPDEYTLVFAANTILNEMTLTRAWDHDVQRYADGTIAALIKARINDTASPSNNPNHAFLYSRYDGQMWTTSYLSKAGKKLYWSEQDYTGLGALDPNDPNTIYISTPLDPRDDADLEVHEIFKGVTSDNGATWSWALITENSTRDNMRPIVPDWDGDNTALLWWRGTYSTAQIFDAAIVGLIEHDSETFSLKSYVDASLSNTTISDGSPLTTTGPDGDRGPGDDQWHERSGYGNGGSVLASAEIDGEDAPKLKTTIPLTDAGMYDVWVNFWANPDYDWRIQAGLSEDGMQLFRHMACQQVEDGDHETSLELSGGGNTYLYQAYLGRVQVSGSEDVDVFIDDIAIETGTEDNFIGDEVRTWYDGVSYASVDIVNAVPPTVPATTPNTFLLSQNYPNPFNPATTIPYSLGERGLVQLAVYDQLGREVALLVNEVKDPGAYFASFDASNLASGVYLYQIHTKNQSDIKKMILIK
ncbi:T9SS type A sorting domain-containing protein [candidate division KSB1 bacterium]|nr:T9SS type A sorting domain-containing protein [candidate division KSB1 bacterium]